MIRLYGRITRHLANERGIFFWHALWSAIMIIGSAICFPTSAIFPKMEDVIQLIAILGIICGFTESYTAFERISEKQRWLLVVACISIGLFLGRLLVKVAAAL